MKPGPLEAQTGRHMTAERGSPKGVKLLSLRVYVFGDRSRERGLFEV